MNRYHLNASIRITLSLIITMIGKFGYTIEAAEKNIQRQVISKARAGNPFNQMQQLATTAPIVTVAQDTNASAINMPLLNVGQATQNITAQQSNTMPLATISNVANQINSTPILPAGEIQRTPEVSVQTITDPALNTSSGNTTGNTATTQLGLIQTLPLGTTQTTQTGVPEITVVAAPIVETPTPTVSNTFNQANQNNSVQTQAVNTDQTASILPTQINQNSQPIDASSYNSSDQLNALQRQQLNIKQESQIPIVSTAPLASTPIINTEQSIPTQEIAIQQPTFNNTTLAVASTNNIPVILPDPTPKIRSRVKKSRPQTINAAIESTTPGIGLAKQGGKKTPQADLSSRIKQLYASIQNSQNQTFDGETYAQFGATLVSTFNEAVEIQSYIIQLLNAAASTPLLNADQQNYVRQNMIPSLDQIDESTKPISDSSKSAVGGGIIQNAQARGKKQTTKKKSKKRLILTQQEQSTSYLLRQQLITHHNTV